MSFGSIWRRTFAEFSHQRHVLFVDLCFVTSRSHSSHSSSCWSPLAGSFRPTISSDMPSTAATRAYDIVSDIWFVWALKSEEAIISEENRRELYSGRKIFSCYTYQPGFVVTRAAVGTSRSVILSERSVKQS